MSTPSVDPLDGFASLVEHELVWWNETVSGAHTRVDPSAVDRVVEVLQAGGADEALTTTLRALRVAEPVAALAARLRAFGFYGRVAA